MENKINIAEILRDCPGGMELDCTICDNDAKIFLEGVLDDNFTYPIEVTIKYNNIEYHRSFTKYGEFVNLPFGKCVIFPKGKTTWEGFVPPCKFKDGDIISNDDYIAIFYKIGTPCICTSPNVVYYHCYYNIRYHKFKEKLDFGIGTSDIFKYATKEEKQKLFDAIKENGYHWNAETKTMEKLQKFKDGDVVACDCSNGNSQLFIFKEYNDSGDTVCYLFLDIDGTLDIGDFEWEIDRLATEEEKKKLFEAIKSKGYKWNAETKTLEKLIIPKFKVGDRIRTKKDAPIDMSNIIITKVNAYSYSGVIGDTTSIAHINFNYQDQYELMPVIPKFKVGDRIQGYSTHINYPIRVVKSLEWDRYRLDNGYYVKFGDEHAYKLLKFDITTLKELKSGVLVRDYDNRMWIPTFWGKYLGDDSNCRYLTTNGCYKYCIPYEGNEHLSGTTNDCDDFYKTWE